VLCFPESYVSDEIITSRAGVRVRIGNTDAEGRMVMADVLCEMKEKVAFDLCHVFGLSRHCILHILLSYSH
jgi:leucyl aminopeptidase